MRIFTRLALDQEPRLEDLAIMNRYLQRRRAVPGGDGFRWQWTGDGEALEKPLWVIAQSAADLLVSEERAFVRQCGASGCRQLFLSRNRQRFWCDMNTCGNRAKGRRQRRFKRFAEEAALRRKPAAGSGTPSSPEAARGVAEDEHPTPPAAMKRLDDVQSTGNGTLEWLVADQPTALDGQEGLVGDVTTEPEPEEGLVAAQPTSRKS